ncbi:MAG: HupE/UreJ family protein [Bacteroidota bacterium]
MYINFTTHWSKLLFLSLLMLPTVVDAHQSDQSYIYMRIYADGIGGRFEVTNRDLNRTLELNLPDALRLEDILPHKARIQAYLDSVTTFQAANKRYTIQFDEVDVLNIDEIEDYAKFSFTLLDLDEVPKVLEVRYSGFFEGDKLHKGILVQEYNWKAGVMNNESMVSSVFSPGDETQKLSSEDASIWKGLWVLIQLGMWHIWIGLDHLLFIIALILPAVVRRRAFLKERFSIVDADVSPNYSSTWLPVASFSSALLYILFIVTFFTIAHSVTLALAALEVVHLSPHVVESIIAISIALAAIHNITPIFKEREWAIAFLFGLFHGFGFASVLGEKGLSSDYTMLSLLGFNIGVEFGQLLIILFAFPTLFFLRKSNFYPKFITFGSVVLIFISIYWFIERAFGVKFAIGSYLISPLELLMH